MPNLNLTFTDAFRRHRTDSFMNDLDTNDYYIGIGKSEGLANNNPIDLNDIQIFEDAKKSIASLHKLQGGNAAQRLLPVNRLEPGVSYKGFDPFDMESFDSNGNLNGCLTVLDDVFVLLHLSHNETPLTSIPSISANDTNYRIVTAGDHIFAFVGVVSPQFTGVCTQFDNFLPVNAADSSFTSTTKQILTGFSVKHSGSDYSSPTIDLTLYHNNTTTPFQIPTSDIEFSGGEIISVDFSDFIENSPQNIEHVDVAINDSTGTGAVLIPIITPENGLEIDLYEVTPSWRVLLSGSFQGHMSADVFPNKPLLIPFSQISVLRNPEVTTAQSTMNILPYFILNQSNVNIQAFEQYEPGAIITQDSTGAKAFFDGFAEVETTNGTEYRVFFHQNYEPQVNTLNFGGGDIEIDGIQHEIESVNPSELYEPSFSESIVYLENLENPIERQANQIDNIQIILTF